MEQVARFKRTWNLAPVLEIVQKIQKNIALAYIYQLTKSGGLMHPVSCSNTHHDVTDLVNHGMVKNTKLEYFENGTELLYEIKNFLNCASDGTFREVIILQRR